MQTAGQNPCTTQQVAILEQVLEILALSEEEEEKKTLHTNNNDNDDDETTRGSSSVHQSWASLPDHQVSSLTQPSQSPGKGSTRKRIVPSCWLWPTKKKSEELTFDDEPAIMDGTSESHHHPDSMDTSSACWGKKGRLEKPATTTKGIGTDDKGKNSSPTSEASSDKEPSSQTTTATSLPKSDPAGIVLERDCFLFEREHTNNNQNSTEGGMLPPYYLFYANSKCIAVCGAKQADLLLSIRHPCFSIPLCWVRQKAPPVLSCLPAARRGYRDCSGI
jgi:hypothetical protein